MPIKKVVKKFNFPKNDLIELVLDIDSYNEFLPWCKSSKILKIDEDNSLLFLKGSVPGKRSTIVRVYK